jgi:hypothetical protein
MQKRIKSPFRIPLMRRLGFLLNFSSKVTVRPMPPVPSARVSHYFRRRLNDGVERLFEEACTANNLSAAADLIALLEKWHTSRAANQGGERRIGDATLRRVRHKLERLSAMRGLPLDPLRPNSTRENVDGGEPAYPTSGAGPFTGFENAVSHGGRDGYTQRWQNVINRLTAEVEKKNGLHQVAVARIGELEALLRYPVVRKALLRALHPDTHPDMNDDERRALTAQFQKTWAQLNNLSLR